jgi:hypothetical protein
MGVGFFCTVDLLLEISSRRGRWKISLSLSLSSFYPNLKERVVENTRTHVCKSKSISVE